MAAMFTGRRMDLNNMTVRIIGETPTDDGLSLEFDIEEIRLTPAQIVELDDEAYDRYRDIIRVVPEQGAEW